ncbi:unnamed protein product, partial [Nippostrongylus brasiliensis]|uniref:G_PROTEIN_RECEP_F1_2 domain-containing protein n=1 Tax=Nippostrongylus brasiliensis TaxID=27835 RepID=A0A0N4XMX6_NIPBR
SVRKVRVQFRDLSDTSISELPIIGLKNLKTLALRNVPTLKKLPPVLSFTHLETAHFTYAHHCCLFKHVDDVVEGENGLYKNNAKEIHHRICKQQAKNRRKREASNNPPSTSELWSNLFEQWLRDADEQIVDNDDDDLPAFDPSEIGATRCLDVEEVANVQGFYHNITCTPQPDAFNPCENIVGLWVLRRAIWPVCMAAIVGNALVWVILGLAFEKRMRVHYLFMINLAIADFITGSMSTFILGVSCRISLALTNLLFVRIRCFFGQNRQTNKQKNQMSFSFLPLDGYWRKVGSSSELLTEEGRC